MIYTRSLHCYQTVLNSCNLFCDLPYYSRPCIRKYYNVLLYSIPYIVSLSRSAIKTKLLASSRTRVPTEETQN